MMTNAFSIAILTLNPCIDRCVYLSVPLTRGTIHRVQQVKQDVAGKGLNQALVLRNLGVVAEYYSFGSRQADDAADAWISQSGIRYHKTPTACGIRTNLKIIDADGTGTEINERGGPVSADELQAILADVRRSGAGVLSICGSLPQGVEPEVYAQLIATARQQGRVTVLDADGEALRCGIEARPDYIKPNRRELAGLCGVSEAELSDETTLLKLCREIHARYGTNVLCTLDEQGSLYVGNEGCYRVGIVKAPLRGFSGAGDTYLAAFLWARYAQHSTIEVALATAARASAAKIALEGTQLPTRAQLDAMGEAEVFRCSQENCSERRTEEQPFPPRN